jgi:ADP-ribosyl-[dinitrogen reductase] hydrolase
MIDLSAALACALAAADDARQLLLTECARTGGPRGEIGQCAADLEAELLIRARLLDAFPTWGYIGEETEPLRAQKDDAPVWIVDPNDGTSSMQRGYRGHAIAIGLVYADHPVLGVVHAVDAPDDSGDLFAWADGCGPPRRNGAPVTRAHWTTGLDASDVVALSQGANRNPLGYGGCVAPARFVGLPSIAYRLALVAYGECAATLSLNQLGMWDYAAGHALVRGAGGVVLDEIGNEIRYTWNERNVKRRIFAGSPHVVRQLIRQNWKNAPGSGYGDAAPPQDLAPIRATPDALIHNVGILRRAQGCLLGQLAGDSLGALVEFSTASDIARAYPKGGPSQLASGGPHHIIAGQPTDDSELALLLARHLIVDGDFNRERIARAYAGWYHGWTHADAPDACTHSWCRPFDIGATIGSALENITPDDASNGRAAAKMQLSANAASQSNGALMRISPLGIWGALHSPDEVASAARQDAALTHPHSVAQDCSAILAVTIGAAIRDGLDPGQTYQFACEWARTDHVARSVQDTLHRAATAPPPDYTNQQGWVLIAIHNAFFRLLHVGEFENGVVETVRAGGDTDTNAAICGALLGAVFGRSSIPAQWQHMVLTARAMPGWPGVQQPRPAIYWPTDALVIAERLVTSARDQVSSRL